eukprot:4234153-Amphidinium_carterae.1
MQEVNCKATSRRQPTSTLNSRANRTLKQDPAVATVHVQRTIEGMEQKASLNGELLQLGKRHSLIALGTI